MTDRTLVDTSFLYALYDTRDRHHARVEQLNANYEIATWFSLGRYSTRP